MKHQLKIFCFLSVIPKNFYNKNIMLTYTILLYENDPKKDRHFSSITTELGMKVVRATTPEAVQEAINTRFFELALININLPAVKLHPETKCILYGHPDKNSISQITHLQPAGIIPAPFKGAATYHMLIKVSGLLPTTQTLPCLLIEAEALLQEKLFNLQALLNQPEYHLSFTAFPDRYCGKHCTFAIPAQDIPNGSAEHYQALGTTTARGHMVCAFKKDCRLFQLAANLGQEAVARPAATLLTTKNVSSATTQTLVMKLKGVADAYRSTTAGLLEARRQLCHNSCNTSDVSGDFGAMKKTKCCGFGCVLDNYLDLTPPKDILSNTKALIYDHDNPETKTLSFLCKEFGMESFSTNNGATAQQYLSSTTIPFAFVNPELDRIAIPHKTRVVVVDELSIGMIARTMAYRPIGIIPKPIDISTLSIAFSKALNIPFTQESFLSLINNLEMELTATHLALSSWFLEETHKYKTEISLKYFCENYCSFAVSKDSLNNKDLSKYYLLDPFTRRGALYCAHKPDCKLWELHAKVLSPRPKEADKSPTDLLLTPVDNDQATSLLDQMTLACERVSVQAKELNDLRHAFCTKQCNKKCEDFKIKKGDLLFSTLDEILNRNTFVYCQEHACPVMGFFQYFRRTMA